MPSTDQLSTEIGAGDRSDGDALGDMQQRLAQLCQQIDQARAGLPDQHADLLDRIEQGIGGLSQSMAVFARDRQAPRAAARPCATPDTDSPWDAESAEALTRVYELAEAELRDNEQSRPQPKPPRQLPLPMQPEGTARQDREPDHDRAWLEQRFAEIAALLGRSLADISPDRSVAALNQRLDQFEQRLDAALGSTARQADAGTLNLIEAHINELTSQFEATRAQLGRLDAIDEQLRDLARMLESRKVSQPEAAGLSVETLKALIDTAAERAAGQLAASMSPSTMVEDAEGRTRIEALEGLLQEYMSERRRGEEVSAGILQTIEDALMRIVDRIDAMEEAKTAPVSPGEDDGLAMESERLAEAYAAGARVLGQSALEANVDAGDYAPSAQREEGETPAEPAAPGTLAIGRQPTEAAPQDVEMRRELRASAMRAKLKAQAMPDAPTATNIGPDENHASPARRAQLKASAGTARSRFSLLLLATMVMLFGAGYLVVDAFLGNASSGTPAAEIARSGQPPGFAQPQPGQGPASAGFAPTAAPEPQSPQRQHVPETVTNDLTQSEPSAPRSRAGQLFQADPDHLAATPANLSREAVPGALPLADVAHVLGLEDVPPPAVGTAALRYAAASGDPAAQFEVASRFAEGKGVAQNETQAFAWFQRAAVRGHVPAQFRVGIHLERGIGVAADPERAKVWYRRAAEHGHTRAMHNLAVLTVGEDKTEAGYAAAAHWFAVAADRGLTDSQFNLGLLHEDGRGVAPSLPEAYKWYALAARGGDKEAARRLERLKARLAPGDIAVAEQRLAQWRARPGG